MEPSAKTKLTGDLKWKDFEEESEQDKYDRAQNFLLDLEILMLKYKIEKVDVCWKKF